MSLSQLPETLYSEDGHVFERPIDWYAGLGPVGHDADDRTYDSPFDADAYDAIRDESMWDIELHPDFLPNQEVARS